MSHYLFGYFYSSYPAFISFLFGGIALKTDPYLNPLLSITILALPIVLCYVPAYKAVFSNDKYLKYFKQFKKEDHQWRKTWRVRTIAFCLGSVFVTILGIVVMWGIFYLCELQRKKAISPQS